MNPQINVKNNKLSHNLNNCLISFVVVYSVEK